MARTSGVDLVCPDCVECSCQDFRFIQLRVNFIRLERDYVQDGFCLL